MHGEFLFQACRDCVPRTVSVTGLDRLLIRLGQRIYFVVDCFVKGDAKRPPIYLVQVASSCIDFWRQVGESTRLAVELLVGLEIRCDILYEMLGTASQSRRGT